MERFWIIGSLITMIILNGCASVPPPQAASLDSILNDLAGQIVSSLPADRQVKIALTEFSGINGESTMLDKFLVEELTTRLYRTGRIDLVERSLMNRILKEQNLSLYGYVDENSAVAVGKILGVDAIPTGTTVDLGASVKVNARLISPETGKVFAVASVNIPKDEMVLSLLNPSAQSNLSTENVSEAAPAKAATHIVEIGDFKFELVQIRQSGEMLICQFKISNLSAKDQTLRLSETGRASSGHVNTMVITPAGDELKQVNYRFGSESPVSLNRHPGLKDKMILAGMSIPLELQFENVTAPVKTLPLLQLVIGDYPGKLVKWKNITVQ